MVQVLDAAWCPNNSTVFGAVTADGRLELWDFAVSTLRPVVQHAVTKCAMTALLFAKVIRVLGVVRPRIVPAAMVTQADLC